MSDGAGAVLLMKRSVAMQKGLPILGVFRYLMGSTEVMILENTLILISNWHAMCFINKEAQ